MNQGLIPEGVFKIRAKCKQEKWMTKAGLGQPKHKEKR